jgi:hypothetical protein
MYVHKKNNTRYNISQHDINVNKVNYYETQISNEIFFPARSDEWIHQNMTLKGKNRGAIVQIRSETL